MKKQRSLKQILMSRKALPTSAYSLTGAKFSRLTVLHRDLEKTARFSYWVCICTCGKVKSIRGTHLISGKVVSCGCYAKEQASIRATTHGLADRCSEYSTWVTMRQRCSNPNNHKYDDYGGRGIKVCARWSSFENFLNDMGRKPAKYYSIDRINNDGNYEPSNCRWATPEQQVCNQRPRKLYGKKRTIVKTNFDEFYGQGMDGVAPKE